MESKADERKEEKMDMSQDKAMIKKAFKQHDMQEHKGGKGTNLKLKKGGKMATGGVVNGQGGFATGGVVNGQGGFATGGVAKSNGGGYKKGGKIKKMAVGGGLLSTLGGAMLKPGSSGGGGGGDDASSGLGSVNSGASTIGKALSNIRSSVGGGGGSTVETPPTETMYEPPPPSSVPSPYKRGGKASKKAYAAGGTVNSGRPVAMPQGRKPASKPVAINELAGTYKRGGRVDSKMKLKEGGDVDLSKGAYDDTLNEPPMGMGFAKKAHSFMDSLFGGKKEAGAGRGFVNPKSITKSKESVTVAPMKKGGRAC
jgi:hypothetical protein